MKSFRAQLAVRATAAAAVGLGVLSLITVVTLRAVLDRELNSSILNVAAIQAASLADGPEGEMHFHEWDLTPDEAASVRGLIQYAQVWGEGGESLLRSRYMTSDLPVDTDALSRSSGGELVWADQEFEDTPVRALFYPLERLGPAHQAHVLQVAAPMTGRNGMVRRSGLFLALLTASLAALTFPASWWLAESAVRPVHAVIDQAEEIGAGSLGRGIRAYADTIEYRRLVEVLNTMLTRLEASFEAQRRFTADASHELRSPLTVMRGEIELALRRVRAPDEYMGVLESTLEEVVRLSAITEDLLMLARSDAGALGPRHELADVVNVANRVVDRLKGRADAKCVTLELSGAPSVDAMVDPGLMRQAVWNLAENALKFTPRGGLVRISIDKEGDQVIVVVSDTGPGLGDLEPSTVFERFYRADTARSHGSDTAGTGLGLAIVKAVAEAHGGAVSAANRREGGGRFELRFPSSIPEVGEAD